MYHSDIADNLKIQIDNEMNNLVNNTKLITLDQYITNVNSKEELENMKLELLPYDEYGRQKSLEKQKILVKVKEAGYVNALVLLLIVIFVLGIAVGIGYMLFKFGV